MFVSSKLISGVLDNPNPPGKYVFTPLSIFDFLSAHRFLRSIRFLNNIFLSAFRTRILSSSLKEVSIFFPDEIPRSVKRLTLFAAPELNFSIVSATANKTLVRVFRCFFRLPFWVLNHIPFEQAIYLLSKMGSYVNFEAFLKILWQFKDC